MTKTIREIDSLRLIRDRDHWRSEYDWAIELARDAAYTDEDRREKIANLTKQVAELQAELDALDVDDDTLIVEVGPVGKGFSAKLNCREHRRLAFGDTYPQALRALALRLENEGIPPVGDLKKDDDTPGGQ